MTVLAEYVAAALIEASKAEVGGVSLPRDKLADLLRQKLSFSSSEDAISAALKILGSCDIARSETDDFAGHFVVISETRFERFLEKVRSESERYDEIVRAAPDENAGLSRAESAVLPYLEAYGRYKILRKYSEFGAAWLHSALDGIKAANAEDIEVPASDRVVRLDDNDPEVARIRQAASELRHHILKGNDLGDISPEQANALANEVYQIEDAFSQAYVRPAIIGERAKKTLRWIADKALGTLVGKAATGLLTMILTYLGLK